MRISGSPQMRQSEGNRTAKRLSAAWLAQVREWDGTSEASTSLTLAWLARIRSSLLLKTASPGARTSTAGYSGESQSLHSAL